MAGRCFFRVDYSVEIGTGHLMRCLTLAHALQEWQYESYFVYSGKQLPPQLANSGFVAENIASTSIEEDAYNFLHTVQKYGSLSNVLCIVDSYNLGLSWERKVRGSVRSLLAIDDIAREHNVDFLLDQNEYINKNQRYLDNVNRDAICMLGSRFALLRKEFTATNFAIRNQIRRVLINFGGTDPARITLPVLRSLIERFGDDSFHVDIVIGALQPEKDQIVECCRAQKNWVLHIQTNDMHNLMAAADVCLGASGSTVWERCALALPTIMVVIAENQIELAKTIEEAGAALCVGNVEHLGKKIVAQKLIDCLALLQRHPSLLRTMSKNASQLCDGKGVNRVVASLLATNIQLQDVTLNDAHNLWSWRYSSEVSRFSGDGTVPKYTEHVEWLENMLADVNRRFWIAMLNETPLSVIRLDQMNEENATISIYLVPGNQGLGWGTHILKQVQHKLQCEKHKCKQIVAEIHPANYASQKSFDAASYKQLNQKWVLEL